MTLFTSTYLCCKYVVLIDVVITLLFKTPNPSAPMFVV